MTMSKYHMWTSNRPLLKRIEHFSRNKFLENLPSNAFLGRDEGFHEIQNILPSANFLRFLQFFYYIFFNLCLIQKWKEQSPTRLIGPEQSR